MKLVFVHLGKSNPKHLWANLERHTRLFPHIPVTLVVSENFKRHQLVPKAVEIVYYSRPEETKALLYNLDLPESFRGGFWHFTFERLLALELVHTRDPETPILHVESDVLLLPNFPWSDLNHRNRLMWGKIDMKEDIAALVLSPNLNLTRRLTSELRQVLRRDPSTSDMRALREVAKVLDSTEFEYLPFDIGHAPIAGGFFDVGPIGMYLAGLDPRNSWGRKRFHVSLEHHIVKPQDMRFQMEGGNMKASDDRTELFVYSLHIHSKDQRVFGLRSSKTLRSLIELQKYNPGKTDFVLSGFLTGFVQFFSEILSKQGILALSKKLLRFFGKRIH